jgi:hypothetical protein
MIADENHQDPATDRLAAAITFVAAARRAAAQGLARQGDKEYARTEALTAEALRELRRLRRSLTL